MADWGKVQTPDDLNVNDIREFRQSIEAGKCPELETSAEGWDKFTQGDLDRMINAVAKEQGNNKELLHIRVLEDYGASVLCRIENTGEQKILEWHDLNSPDRLRKLYHLKISRA